MSNNMLFLYVVIILASFALTVLLEKQLIPMLKRRAQQPIYEEGPNWHKSKTGTPTMGGVGFIIPFFIIMLLTLIYFFKNGYGNDFAVLLTNSLFCILNGAIGFIDDATKLYHKENAGLSPKQKFLLQSALAILYLSLMARFIPDITSLRFSFGSYDIGYFYFPIAFIAITASVNCANLTDGVDGISAGVAYAIGISVFYIAYESFMSVAISAITLAGLCLGFLVFNIHPAKIFMGDTGSLFIGALTATFAVTMKNPLLLIFIGIVYLIEGLSVIIQVLVYKLTKKRVFKMAPLHHHLEKCGFEENKIVLIAMVTTLVFAFLATFIFK